MRVVAGKEKGIRLKTSGSKIRPTADKVKESIFNIIQAYVEDSVVLDLFAGTGALGIEALSRNAKLAVFIDKDRHSINIIKENLLTTKLSDKAIVINGDYQDLLQKNKGSLKFDIVFLDPPYKQHLIDAAIDKLITCNVLSNTAIIICESDIKENALESYEKFPVFKKYVYGQTVIRVFFSSL